MRFLKLSLAMLLAVIMIFGSGPLAGVIGLKLPYRCNSDYLKIEASARSESIYTFSVTEGKAVITDIVTTTSGAISIPSSLEEYPVIGIGEEAFAFCKEITSVMVPNSVKSIGASAFSRCTGLTSIDLPDGLTSIEHSTFSGCTNLTSIVVPDGVTSIGAAAFSGCTGLSTVNLPNSLTSIENGSFIDCTSLKNITIPDSVASINTAFLGCTGLTDILVSSANTKYTTENGVLFNKTKTDLIQYPGGKIGEYTIPEGVRNIVDGSFQKCIGLKAITIPNSVTTIPMATFYGCTELQDIHVALDSMSFASVDGVLYNKIKTEIIQYPTGKKGAFKVPDYVSNVGISAFYNCTELISIYIPDSVTNIGEYAFDECTALTEIDVSSDNMAYTSLNGILFDKTKESLIICPAGKTGLCNIPESVINIGEKAFEGCTGLTGIDVSSDNTAYASDNGVLFDKSKVRLIRFPNGKAGEYAVPDNVTAIETKAFSGCSGLTAITLSQKIKKIENSTFKNCFNLNTVILPNDLKEIGIGAFAMCSQLTSIKIPGRVNDIASSAFTGCEKITLLCDKNSYAEKYAIKYGLAYTANENITSNYLKIAFSVLIAAVFGAVIYLMIRKKKSKSA